MTTSFAIAFDYLCPVARNACEYVVAALRAGADWDVHFVPYSLAQGHVEEGAPAVWERDRPELASGVLALQVGLVVRDHLPERFLDVHEGLFAARHDEGADIKDPAVLSRVLRAHGVEPAEIFGLVADGVGLKTLRSEHEAAVRDHGVWGVPTIITEGRAVFVRLMDRPAGDGELGRQRIQQVLDLVTGAPHLIEFKQTDLPA